ncbi:D-alanine--D-alanine ligase [Paenibacillus aquistagni]|uniref:D-alanine--D-alanine ligase n=1 Tax=Paenibacillus aquistagni TaxID=1852522 RepID=A0A1X7LA27_9BACL|nr:D-alanine--D-alanine ligase [Paenibacillus aquistagni]SMG50698.1 D-alanine--D-alanine ligase [Paenibacillus aquistagni]
MKVGVIMGGVSSELNVSMMTGKEIMAKLDQSQYEVVPVVITRTEELVEKTKGIDIALLALHGKFGEDGTIQGALETMGIPYTGSGVMSSSMCMNKDITKKLLRYEGVHTPDWLCWNSMEECSVEAVEQLGYPVIVKPNSGGSSIGAQVVLNRESLLKAVEAVFAMDSTVMIERYTAGDEITCSILNGKLLPHLGIRANQSTWFDYQAKYEDGGAIEEVIQLPPELDALVGEAALKSYRALHCSVYARVDMIIQNGIPYVLEINTLPGMTSNSLLPKSAQAAGLSFQELLEQIIAISLEQRRKERGGQYVGC